MSEHWYISWLPYILMLIGILIVVVSIILTGDYGTPIGILLIAIGYIMIKRRTST
jgi:hypothetical membrane protein